MLRIIILSTVLGLLFFLAPSIGLAAYVHEKKWFILAFFIFISYLNHRLMQLGFANNRQNFVPFYMASLGFRLILGVTFVGFFIYWKTPNLYLFIVNFFILYLCYTGFEIYDLYRKLRLFS